MPGTSCDPSCKESWLQIYVPSIFQLADKKSCKDHFSFIQKQWIILNSLLSLKSHAACLACSFHDCKKFKLFLDQILSRNFIEWRILINNMHNLQWPDKEYAWFMRGVGLYFKHLHVLKDFSFLGDSSPQYLGCYLKNKLANVFFKGKCNMPGFQEWSYHPWDLQSWK